MVKLCKHALDSQPHITVGDIILLAETKDNLVSGEKPIRYLMEFHRIYADSKGESERIWGKHWRYIIEGRGCRTLKRPFDICEIQLTETNYAQGGPYVYVARKDEDMLNREGYLDTF